MSPEEQYPSTDDCGTGFEDEDLVIVCIDNAQARYLANPSREEYIEGPAVCAIGAVWAEGDGEDIEEVVTGLAYEECLRGPELAAAVEEHLREEAKAAIRLLNAAALARHPEMKYSAVLEEWTGPLEWVNQSWRPDGYDWDDALKSSVVREVSACYELAKEMRRAELRDGQ